ncbi:MAG: hypothetical protein K2X48_14555 [Chitinophagaceae bacterium]|nr:hypothetical protein [Chitinophagaceae bacterium]
MKPFFLTALISCFFILSNAQFVAKMEVKEPIPGICDSKNVCVMFPTFKRQEEAVCPVTNEEILKRLNAEVSFLKDKPDYTDKGMIGIIINCKGVVVQCKMDNKTKSTELDQQIEAVFNSLGEWKAGKLNKKSIDTSRLFSFKIVNGVFTFER